MFITIQTRHSWRSALFCYALALLVKRSPEQNARPHDTPGSHHTRTSTAKAYAFVFLLISMRLSCMTLPTTLAKVYSRTEVVSRRVSDREVVNKYLGKAADRKEQYIRRKFVNRTLASKLWPDA